MVKKSGPELDSDDVSNPKKSKDKKTEDGNEFLIKTELISKLEHVDPRDLIIQGKNPRSPYFN